MGRQERGGIASARFTCRSGHVRSRKRQSGNQLLWRNSKLDTANELGVVSCAWSSKPLSRLPPTENHGIARTKLRDREADLSPCHGTQRVDSVDLSRRKRHVIVLRRWPSPAHFGGLGFPAAVKSTDAQATVDAGLRTTRKHPDVSSSAPRGIDQRAEMRDTSHELTRSCLRASSSSRFSAASRTSSGTQSGNGVSLIWCFPEAVCSS